MYSDFIVYADESGDHGLTSIDPQYPVFVLAFCIFRKAEYGLEVIPPFLDLKFSTFGHDAIVLHSHDIRKQNGLFAVLTDAAVRKSFNEGLSAAMARVPFTVVASVIDKIAHQRKYANPDNPYDIALRFCLERTYAFLRDAGQHARKTHIVVEARGRNEDRDLELAFRRIIQGANRWGVMPFELIFADKRINSTGLQIADLVAHPIGRHCIDPAQPNRAWDIVEPKLRRSGAGKVEGYGLKRFP